MARLAAKDLDAVLGFTLDARSAEDLATFRGDVVAGLRRLVACDSFGYNEVDLASGTAMAVTDVPLFDGIARRFVELTGQHPLVARQAAGDLRTYLLSDFLSEREFHRLELYQDIYRLLDTEDQIAFGLPGDVIVAVVLNRSRRTFTERDRAVLELLRPHLAQAYEHVLQRERSAALIEAVEASLAEHHAAVIQVDRGGRLTHASAAARELLDAYFDGDAGRRATLPAVIAEWAGNGAEQAKLTVAGPRGRLHVRAASGEARDGRRFLLLDEQRTCPPSVESLRMLGLTTREAQVLRLLACGKRTRQIADELFISPATVSKHLEHIYARLGVSSRAEAIARVYA